MGTKKINRRLLLISSIVPGENGGGAMVLKRHFDLLKDFEILIISDGEAPGFSHVILPQNFLYRILRKLFNGKFKPFFGNVSGFIRIASLRAIKKITRDFRPDVILTVAHGDFFNLASLTASSLGIPLVSIFHDWWPDLSGCNKLFRARQDKQFRNLHRASNISLSICEGMLSELGSHSAGEVLFPIPLKTPTPRTKIINRPSSELRIIYMGNLRDYGEMVRDALEEIQKQPELRLEVSGGNPLWPIEYQKTLQFEGLWHNFLPEEKLIPWLEQADAYLVVMRFDIHLRRFMETSFPSKITHYAQLRKPIIIWGPEYCSAIQWARINDSALCVTDPSPDALVLALKTLSPSECDRWAAKAHEAATNEFDPETIQEQFLSAIADTEGLRVCGNISKSGG